MTKRKIDELEILEKLVKQKYISFNLILVALPLLNTAKNDSKTKKTPSPLAPRLSKYKTVDENGIQNFQQSSMQETRYSMIKTENMQLIFAAKCVHN